MATRRQKSLIVLVGETGSGKTDAAIDLAQRFNGEVISADSWTVYKGFDIGTAKPTLAERRGVMHYLIDIADPLVGFSAAEFKRLCLEAMAEIETKGKLPILVGGTGLYVDSVVFDYSFLPVGDPTRREKLNNMELGELQALVRKRNLDTNGIDIRNKRRIIRLIENNGQRPKQSETRPDTLLIGIKKANIDDLTESVSRRVDDMLATGLEHEVLELSKQYGWDIEPMKGTGYKEFKDYFIGRKSLAETRQDIIRNTLKLAKKQRTWFQHNNSIQWVQNRDQVVDLVTTFLNNF